MVKVCRQTMNGSAPLGQWGLRRMMFGHAGLLTAFSRGLRVAVMAAFAISGASAEAQVCSGAAPFSSGFLRFGIGGGRIGAGFGGADGEPSVGARVSVGATQGLFGSVGSSMVLYSRSNRFIREGLAKQATDDASAGNVSLAGGYAFSVSPSRRVQVCPMAGLSNQNGPLLYSDCRPLPSGGISCSGGADGSARALWFGGSVGGLARVTRDLAFVPFAAAAHVNSKITAGGRNVTDSYLEFTVGVGLLYKRLTLRPALSFPMGLEGGSGSLGIEFALNVGRD